MPFTSPAKHKLLSIYNCPHFRWPFINQRRILGGEIKIELSIPFENRQCKLRGKMSLLFGVLKFRKLSSEEAWWKLPNVFNKTKLKSYLKKKNQTLSMEAKTFEWMTMPTLKSYHYLIYIQRGFNRWVVTLNMPYYANEKTLLASGQLMNTM